MVNIDTWIVKVFHLNKYRQQARESLALVTRKVNDFTIPARVRLQPEQLKIIKKIIKKDKEKYGSLSHFYRIAIIKLIREEKERMKI